MNPSRKKRLAERKLREIMLLMDKDELSRIKTLLDGHETDPSWPDAEGMLYVYARLEEEAAFGGDNTTAALNAFSELSAREGPFQAEGLIGRARILCRLNEKGNADEVLDLCRQAIEIDNNVKAMMITGQVFENTKLDANAACKWYLRAYRSGLPWGLRFYAALQSRRGKVLRSTLGHLAATITSPILVALFGARDPFK